MKAPHLLLLASITLAACSPDAESTTEPAASLELVDGQRTRVQQRGSEALPGSDARILLSIGDISMAHTQATLHWRNGARIAGPTELKEGDALRFTLGEQGWNLRLEHLHNELIGDDWAEFTLLASRESTPPDTADAAAATREIEALINAIATLEGAQFIRNSKAHPASEAADHLRRKWRRAGDRIRSAEDFIEGLASASSITRQPYQIRLADGTTVSSRDWLLARLSLLRGEPR